MEYLAWKELGGLNTMQVLMIHRRVEIKVFMGHSVALVTLITMQLGEQEMLPLLALISRKG